MKYRFYKNEDYEDGFLVEANNEFDALMGALEHIGLPAKMSVNTQNSLFDKLEDAEYSLEGELQELVRLDEWSDLTN